MNRSIFLASLLAIGAIGLTRTAHAQSVLYDFETGTDQGFGHKFGDDASETFPIVNIGGSQRMQVLRNGDFQEADISTGNTSLPFYQAMLAASGNEAGYQISYDWYVDTSTFGAGAGNYLQLATYVNTGTGYYAQNFGAVKEVEINGTQLASGGIFSGTVTQTFVAKGFDLPAGETFFRFGLIINGDGAAQTVYYDNISIGPVPNHTSLLWNGPANGNWDHATQNFTNTTSSAASVFTDGDTVTFGDATSGTINLVGTLAPDAVNVNSPGNYVFSGSGAIGGAALLSKFGTGNLTISTSNSFTGSVTVGGGTLTINNPAALGATTAITLKNNAILASNLTVSLPALDLGFGNGQVSVAAGQTVTITGAVTGNESISKTGPGTLTFAGTDVHAGNTAVTNGILNINTTSRHTNGQLVVAGAGHAQLGAPASATSYVVAGEFSDIIIDSDLSVAVTPVDRSVNKPVVLIASNSGGAFGGSVSGLIDLGNSDMIVRNADIGGLRGMVGSWYNNGGRDGTSGIGTTDLSNAMTTLAVFPNSALASGYFSNYDGITLVPADAIIKYTYVGDTNLDGVVNGADLARVIQSLSVGGLTGWENGDVNYDGVVNATDVTLTRNALLANLPSLGNGQGDGGNGGSVPEPTTALLAIGASPMMLRRRRA